MNPFNSYVDETDECIRQPDTVKTERLVEDDRPNYEKDIDEAIYQSLIEMESANEFNAKYEEELLKQHERETEERKAKFSKLLFDVKRLVKYDKNIEEVCNIIEPIIEMYCEQFISTVEMDADTYEKIFNTLGTLRTIKMYPEVIALLKTIIEVTYNV